MYEYEGSPSGTASGSLLPTRGNGNSPTDPRSLRFCLEPSKSAAIIKIINELS